MAALLVILLLVLVITNVLLLRASPAVYQLYEMYMNPESNSYRLRNDRNPYIPVCTSQEVADEEDADTEGDDANDTQRRYDEEDVHDENDEENIRDNNGDSRSKHSVLKLPRIGYPPPSALSKEALMPGRTPASLLMSGKRESS